jgi:hypothetical protein
MAAGDDERKEQRAQEEAEQEKRRIQEVHMSYISLLSIEQNYLDDQKKTIEGMLDVYEEFKGPASKLRSLQAGLNKDLELSIKLAMMDKKITAERREELQQMLSSMNILVSKTKEQFNITQKVVKTQKDEVKWLIKSKGGVVDLSATYKALTGRQTSRLAILFRSLDTLRAMHGDTFKKIFSVPSKGAEGAVAGITKSFPGVSKAAENIKKSLSSATRFPPIDMKSIISSLNVFKKASKTSMSTEDVEKEWSNFFNDTQTQFKSFADVSGKSLEELQAEFRKTSDVEKFKENLSLKGVDIGVEDIKNALSEISTAFANLQKSIKFNIKPIDPNLLNAFFNRTQSQFKTLSDVSGKSVEKLQAQFKDSASLKDFKETLSFEGVDIGAEPIKKALNDINLEASKLKKPITLNLSLPKLGGILSGFNTIRSEFRKIGELSELKGKLSVFFGDTKDEFGLLSSAAGMDMREMQEEFKKAGLSAMQSVTGDVNDAMNNLKKTMTSKIIMGTPESAKYFAAMDKIEKRWRGIFKGAGIGTEQLDEDESKLSGFFGKTKKKMEDLKNEGKGFGKVTLEGLKGLGLGSGLFKKEIGHKLLPKGTMLGGKETEGEASELAPSETGKSKLNAGGAAAGAAGMAVGVVGAVAVIGQIVSEIGQKMFQAIMEVVNILRKASPVFDAIFKMLELSFKLALMPLATIIGIILMPYVRKMMRQSAEFLRTSMTKLKAGSAGLTGKDLEDFQLKAAGEAMGGMFDTLLPGIGKLLGVVVQIIGALLPWAVYELGSIIIDINMWLGASIIKGLIHVGLWIVKGIISIAEALTAGIVSGIITAIKWLLEGIIKLGSWVMIKLISVIEAVGKGMVGAIDWLIPGQQNLADNLGKLFDGIKGGIGDGADSLINTLEETIPGYNEIYSMMSGPYESLKGGLDAGAEAISNAINLITSVEGAYLKDILRSLLLGGDIVAALFGQGQHMTEIKDSVSDVATSSDIDSSTVSIDGGLSGIASNMQSLLSGAAFNTASASTSSDLSTLKETTGKLATSTDISGATSTQTSNIGTLDSSVSSLVTDDTFGKESGKQINAVGDVETGIGGIGSDAVRAADAAKIQRDEMNKLLDNIWSSSKDTVAVITDSMSPPPTIATYGGLTWEQFKESVGYTGGAGYAYWRQEWMNQGGATAAGGGIVTSPMLSLVGESGPEAIIPLDQLNRINQGGKNVTVNLTVSGNVYGVSDLEKAIADGFRKAMYQYNWRA